MQVVAVTGAVGKTSLQDMLREILSRQGRVYAPPRDAGDELAIPDGTDFAVLDCGAKNNALGIEIDILVSTTLIETPAKAASMIAPFGGPCDVSYGENARADWHLIQTHVSADATVGRLIHGGKTVLFKLNAPGQHFARNAVAALAVVDQLDGDLGLAAVDLGHWRPAQGRGQMRHVMLDVVNDALRIDLIDDTAGATPICVEAALNVLACAMPPDEAGRKIAILGDMAGQSEHANLTDIVALNALDLIHCSGPQMRGLYDKLPPDRRGLWAETASELSARPSRLAHAGDVVLVKGAPSMKMAGVVDAIANLGQSVDNLNEGHR